MAVDSVGPTAGQALTTPTQQQAEQTKSGKVAGKGTIDEQGEAAQTPTQKQANKVGEGQAGEGAIPEKGEALQTQTQKQQARASGKGNRLDAAG
jgi:hypothetical protein